MSAGINTAYLLIGGNMGHREAILAKARAEITRQCGAVIRQSALYQTAAWGLEAQADFLNQVLVIQTDLDACHLLHTVLSIEEALGRKRETRYGPRLIDIDLLFFNHDILSLDGLTVPHPQLQNRRFVLVPLAEVAPEFLHPVLKMTTLQLLAACPDTLAVQKFQ